MSKKNKNRFDDFGYEDDFGRSERHLEREKKKNKQMKRDEARRSKMMSEASNTYDDDSSENEF